MTPAQEAITEKLKRGARLEARITKRGKIGDFRLVTKGGRTIRIVPRATIAAICQTAPTGRKPKAQQEAPPSIVQAPPHVVQSQPAPLLDDIARGMAGKPFARLKLSDQDAIRRIAERVAAVGVS